ncbi:MAG: hypothetical protein V8R91_01385 [Butyricimonas faecihominis]
MNLYGITIVLQHKWGFPIGMAALCFNLPLSLLGGCGYRDPVLA